MSNRTTENNWHLSRTIMYVPTTSVLRKIAHRLNFVKFWPDIAQIQWLGTWLHIVFY